MQSNSKMTHRKQEPFIFSILLKVKCLFRWLPKWIGKKQAKVKNIVFSCSLPLLINILVHLFLFHAWTTIKTVAEAGMTMCLSEKLCGHESMPNLGQSVEEVNELVWARDSKCSTKLKSEKILAKVRKNEIYIVYNSE